MTGTLILINGSGGSGKTTTGKKLLQTLDHAAYFDIDALSVVNPWEYGEELCNLALRNAAALITSFFESKYRFVIVSGGCLKEEQLKYLQSFLSVKPHFYWFYLDVGKELRKQRKIDRNRDEADSGKWFEWLENKIGPYEGLPAIEGVVCQEVKADNLTIDQIVGVMRSVVLG